MYNPYASVNNNLALMHNQWSTILALQSARGDSSGKPIDATILLITAGVILLIIVLVFVWLYRDYKSVDYIGASEAAYATKKDKHPKSQEDEKCSQPINTALSTNLGLGIGATILKDPMIRNILMGNNEKAKEQK
jgi:hypothetical protein